MSTSEMEPWKADRKAALRATAALVFLLALAASVRGLYLRELHDDPRIPAPMLDSAINVGWAEAEATGRWDLLPAAMERLRSAAVMPYVRAPGYPLWLAGVFRLTGLGRFGALVIQQGLGLWVVVLVWFATRRWVSRRSSWVAGVLAATHWSGVYYAGEFLDTALLTPLVMTSFVLMGRTAECILLRAERADERLGLRCMCIASILSGVATGTALITRPASRSLLLVSMTWLLWIAWRRQNPSIRASILAEISKGMQPNLSVDVNTDVLLASMHPSWTMCWKTAVRGLPSAFRLARPAILGLLAGFALLVLPIVARNLARGGSVLPLAVGDSVAALVATLPEHRGFDDDDIGMGSRLDRLCNYGQLAEVSGTTSAWGISRHFLRQRRALYYNHPESAGLSLARRIQLFWGPRDVGSSRVVEYDRRSSRILRVLPSPFSLLTSLAILGAVFWRRSQPQDQQSRQARLVPHAMPLLVLGVLVAWTGSHLSFLASGEWRQPLVPLVLFLAAWAVEDVCQQWQSRRWRDVGRWTLALMFIHLALAQNIGGYLPNRAKWLLDRGLALEAVGKDHAARVAYRTALMATPGIKDPEYTMTTTDNRLSEQDARRYQYSAAVACIKLGNHAAQRQDTELALRYFLLASKLEPAKSEALVNAGTVLLGSGRPAKAAELLTEAIQRDSRSVPAYYPLAKALYRLGRYDEALWCLDTLLSLRPDHQEARALRALMSVEP